MLRKVRTYFIAMMILLLGGSVYSSKALQESVFYDWDGYIFGLVLSDDGRSLNVISGRGGTGSYVPIMSSGVGYGTSLGGNGPVFEISNGNIRVSTHGHSWGDWVNIFGSGFSRAFYSFWGLGIETSYGKIRFCVWNWYDTYEWYEWWNCGNWMSVNSCPSGYSYNSSTNKCEATPTFSCPSGYTYNSSTRKCEMSAQITYTCPLGSSYPCINTGSNYYCSPYQCVDIDDQSNTQNTDTTEGANNKTNDGPTDSNGACLGIVRIFNGQDLRCRPPGIQTGWSDCCKKTKTWFGLGQCTTTEQRLAKLRTTIQYRGQDRDYTAADANCHYVGSYCAQKIKFIGCVQKKKTFCCFSSPLARIVQEQGRPQLGKGWGDPKNPDCSGFTIYEFQKLDFSKIDFSEWINMIVGQETANLQNNLSNQTQQMQQNIQNMYK
jgi:hypothetical protein